MLINQAMSKQHGFDSRGPCHKGGLSRWTPTLEHMIDALLEGQKGFKISMLRSIKE